MNCLNYVCWSLLCFNTYYIIGKIFYWLITIQIWPQVSIMPLHHQELCRVQWFVCLQWFVMSVWQFSLGEIAVLVAQSGRFCCLEVFNLFKVTWLRRVFDDLFVYKRYYGLTGQIEWGRWLSFVCVPFNQTQLSWAHDMIVGWVAI